MGYTGRYAFREKATSVGTDTKTFVTPKVRVNELVKITHASVSDFTTANKKLLLGIRDVDNVDYYLPIVQGVATYQSVFSVQLEGEVTLTEGECFIGVVTSPTAADVLYFNVFGDKYEVKPSK